MSTAVVEKEQAVATKKPKKIQLDISGNQLPWKTETVEFVAATGATTLTFTGEMVGGFWGASIDNISVEPQH